ncbi:MAG: UTP--glucose-1-phosphate uridylyltransferase [Rickettsiales bacterium]
MVKIKTAIFPVGGLGTRFLPATKSMPKEMMPIANKPLVQYAFEEAKACGVEKFIFITGRNKNTIANHFDHAYELESKLDEAGKINEIKKVIGWMPNAGQIAFIRQQQPKGLGHAILCAKNFIAQDEPFVVILADELLMPSESKGQLSLMMEKYSQNSLQSSIIGVDEVAYEDVSKYGIIKTENDDKVIDMVEKPQASLAPSRYAINGRYILQPKIFSYLESITEGVGGEIQLTDALKKMCQDFPFYFVKNPQARFDCGNVLGYLEANLAFALNDVKISAEVKQMLKKYIN